MFNKALPVEQRLKSIRNRQIKKNKSLALQRRLDRIPSLKVLPHPTTEKTVNNAVPRRLNHLFTKKRPQRVVVSQPSPQRKLSHTETKGDRTNAMPVAPIKRWNRMRTQEKPRAVLPNPIRMYRVPTERNMTRSNMYKFTMKSLWTHLVFVHARPKKVGRQSIMSRTPMVVNGLFNQMFALFAAVDLAKTLGRQHLVVGNFYVQFNVKQLSVPLSKVIQLPSLLIPTSDWNRNQEPTPSNLLPHHPVSYPPDVLQRLQSEDSITNLEIGCCLLLPVLGHNRSPHIQQLRFHPIFYDIVSAFVNMYPVYQVVHYRMETDFTEAFFSGWGFNTIQEGRANLFQKYQNTFSNMFDPHLPTLVVSHYYKDVAQPRDHDLQWNNLIHFTLSTEQRSQLYNHLQIPHSSHMREIDAIIDFILCTTPNVLSFIGCGGSTFSDSVCLFRNYKNCSMINPHNI